MLLAALILLGTLAAPPAGAHSSPRKTEASVVELTDLNFDELASSGKAWMVDVYAPWCPSCQEMMHDWELLAVELQSEGIRVGKVDGNKERGLVSRFRIQHYPTIFYINATTASVYEYEGRPTLQQLADFARGGWQQAEGRSGCSSPVSSCGRLLGQVTSIPARLKRLYHHLHDDHQYSDLALLVMVLAAPVAIGLSFICAIDAYVSRQSAAPELPYSSDDDYNLADFHQELAEQELHEE